MRERIVAACAQAGRPADAVQLIAVSKTFDAVAIAEAAAAGQRHFGENYLQEALPKLQANRHHGLIWHFIGPLQSNKTKPVAEHFDWVHSIEREKVARRLSEQRPEDRPALQVCIQVNISGEASKSGVAPGEVLTLARAIIGLPRLALRGLMAIPEPAPDAGVQRRRFALLRELQQSLVREGLPLDTLSMGMSADLEAAIAEGATIVRVGTAIFGERVKS